MTSIHSNEGAKLALQTLRAINTQIAETQQQITTGLRVAKADDDPMAWAIAQSLRADNLGWTRVQESLNLGDATLSVARQGAETTVDLIKRIKGHVVTAQAENVDRSKLQDDIVRLRDQIAGIVGMANFNGETLLENRDSARGSGTYDVKSSFQREGNNYTWSTIDLTKRDLTTEASSIAATGGSYTSDAATATLNATQTVTLNGANIAVEAGTAFSLSVFGTDGNGSAFDQAVLRSTAGASESQAEMATGEMSYVARDGEDMGDVMRALTYKFEAWAAYNEIGSDVLSVRSVGSRIEASSQVTNGADTIALALNRLDADAGNTIGGGLEDLGALDVSTGDGAARALSKIDGILNAAVDFTASFGTGQMRLDTQRSFISGIVDQNKAGIGLMVDADMEESSARLQALRVQQELATQALGIMNAAPQVTLALFR